MERMIVCSGCNKSIAKAELNPFSTVEYKIKCDCGAETNVRGVSEPRLL